MISSTFQKVDNKDESMKKLLSTTGAFGLLRRELIENLGFDRVKGFLFRYGWRLGASDAKEAMKISTSIDFLTKQAAILHLNTGQVADIQSERQIKLNNNRDITHIVGKGKWIDSFEAHEHIKHHGISDSPVCHTLTGYANGYMSTITNTKIFVKETSCIGKGDKECIFETKLVEDWGDEIEEDLKYFNEQRIVDELEFTYEQLLEERNYIKRVSNFHRELTQSVSNGSGLQDIANNVHRSLGVPVTIEDLSFENITYAGLDEAEFESLNQQFKENMIGKNQDRGKLPLFQKTSLLELEQHKRVITPIIVQKKTLGYCTFIYKDQSVDRHQGDFQLIESVANAVSLILLNEKTSFEAIEKIKGNLLEQLLTGDYSSEEDIVNRGRYMGVDFKSPYYVAVIDRVNKNITDELLKQQHEQLLETLSKYLDIQGFKVLIGQYDNRVVIYIPESVLKEDVDKMRFIVKVYDHIQRTHSKCKYKIGVSEKTEGIENLKGALKKAIIARRMSNKQNIMDYEELGILGVLINSKNVEIIKEIAEKELGPILKEDKEKNNELLKTLYVFLSNGGNLHQTMDDLSLSMSGLTYRKNKIEKLLNKDLRDPSQSYPLLLILDSLIALEELDLDV